MWLFPSATVQASSVGCLWWHGDSQWLYELETSRQLAAWLSLASSVRVAENHFLLWSVLYQPRYLSTRRGCPLTCRFLGVSNNESCEVVCTLHGWDGRNLVKLCCWQRLTRLTLKTLKYLSSARCEWTPYCPSHTCCPLFVAGVIPSRLTRVGSCTGRNAPRPYSVALLCGYRSAWVLALEKQMVSGGMPPPVERRVHARRYGVSSLPPSMLVLHNSSQVPSKGCFQYAMPPSSALSHRPAATSLSSGAVAGSHLRRESTVQSRGVISALKPRRDRPLTQFLSVAQRRSMDWWGDNAYWLTWLVCQEGPSNNSNIVGTWQSHFRWCCSRKWSTAWLTVVILDHMIAYYPREKFM